MYFTFLILLTYKLEGKPFHLYHFQLKFSSLYFDSKHLFFRPKKSRELQKIEK